MFAKLQTRRDIPLLATYAFQYRNVVLVKYTYCRYTAVQPTLIEVTHLWYNFYDNIAKLQDTALLISDADPKNLEKKLILK